ncbi:hypothetical protein [Nocardioides aurantiacus]|uniref:Uncharacterized protein n=1 Tax=Nocardioides aurantiacus TaxID=86796 RepID=A0A3N2CR56_9ACTN|nr:hypothetical protein [Nocardioides aurantiacus]ROR89989.1 hypothetical protein EDD33_0821 [Nocardioides aurantiacus]
MGKARRIREDAARIDRLVRRYKQTQSRKALVAILDETVAEQRARRLGDLGKLLAAATDPWLLKRAAALDTKKVRTPGRPTAYPNWALLLFGQAIDIYGSALYTDINLGDPNIWALVTAAVRDVHGDHIADALPAIGPSVNHWNHFQKKSKQYGWVDKLRNAHRRAAAEQAVAMGMYEPGNAFQVAKPTREVVVTLDGKVSTSPSKYKPGTEYVNKVTGEIKIRRADPNTDLWPEAGSPAIPEGSTAEQIAKYRGDKTHRYEWGVKGTYAWARLIQSGTRICLDVETMTPDEHDEGRAIVDIVNSLADLLPGLQTVVVDGILHHKHIDPLMRRGLMVVNKPTQGARNGRSSVKVGDRYEKSHHVGTYEKTGRHGTCRHRLYGIGGAVYQLTADDQGNQTHTLLNQRTIRRPGAKNEFNWYRLIDIDCRRCGGVKGHSVPLVAQADDGFLRSEYLRQMAITDTNFATSCGFRPDAESGNNGIEQAWYLKRMPAYGHHNQSLRMLLHAAQINAEAWHIHNGRLAHHDLLPDPEPPKQVAA